MILSEPDFEFAAAPKNGLLSRRSIPNSYYAREGVIDVGRRGNQIDPAEQGDIKAFKSFKSHSEFSKSARARF